MILPNWCLLIEPIEAGNDMGPNITGVFGNNKSCIKLSLHACVFILMKNTFVANMQHLIGKI